MIGFGTEKIDEEIKILFPSCKVARLDLDTTRSKNAYEEIIKLFENKEIDILIGTQMITKGLDFDHVSLVGILDADMLLNRPDFRAFERSYHLMSQVAGRAGRKFSRGKVIIQTGNPDHWVIRKIIDHDYPEFYRNELVERRNFFYPPFYKMITLTLKHKDEHVLSMGAYSLAFEMRNIFKERVLGPEYAIIKRVNNLFQKQIILKVEREVSNQKVKEKLQELIDVFFIDTAHKAIHVVIDVDPM
jgi:primosomal protein N' (replication factor Y)